MFRLLINDYSVCLKRNFNAPHINITSGEMMLNQNSCLSLKIMHIPRLAAAAVLLRESKQLVTAEMSFIKVSHLCAQA